MTCAAPAYLAGRTAPDTPAALERDHRIVSYFSAATGRRVPLRYAREGETIEFTGQPAVSVNESTAHLNTILAGLGIGQTFGFVVRPQVEAGRLVELLPAWKPAPLVLHLVYPANRFQSRKLRVFAD